MVTELHFINSKVIKGKEKKGKGLTVIKMLITFIQSNQKPMKSSPQFLSRVIHQERPVVLIDLRYGWDIVERMKKISVAAHGLENT